MEKLCVDRTYALENELSKVLEERRDLLALKTNQESELVGIQSEIERLEQSAAEVERSHQETRERLNQVKPEL